jgi:hypothetical protein
MTLTAQAIRTAQGIALDTNPGLPALPFIPVTWLPADQLSPAQQEANLLHVALWAVGRLLLGEEAEYHFNDSNADALCFLRRVISRNSP